MYKVGDKVVHQKEGACYVKALTQMKMENTNREYYVLEPLCDKKAKIYIAVRHDKQQRIRPALSQKQMKESEEIAVSTESDWITDAKRRQQSYAKTISCFDFLEVFIVLKQLTVQNAKKRLSSSDAQLLLNAQKLVYSEMAIVADKDYEVVAENVNRILSAESVEL